MATLILFAPVSALAQDVQGAAALPHDLSPHGMFMNADWVVKAVMIGLFLASIGTWTIWLAKSIELANTKRRLTRSAKVLSRLRSPKDAAELDGVDKAFGQPILALMEDELSWSTGAADHKDGVKERLTSSLNRAEAALGRRLTRGMGYLATVGATAPFIGLFGTVWGIMNSFIGISEAQTTNLAVVAPGIAEALFATALGLAAAIPAVVIYNHFSRRVNIIKSIASDMTAAVSRLASRRLDAAHIENIQS